MIDGDEPESWRDLQNRVARILNESGVRAETEKEIRTARGSVRADVWAFDSGATPAQTYLVECKYWRASVPQTIVHAFRTVVGDSGSNWGAIVAASGFQSGAREAAQYSNVRLLTWPEFQALFAPRWFKQHFIPTIANATLPLNEYTEPINSRIFRRADALDERRRQEFITLRETYFGLGAFCLTFEAERAGAFRLITGEDTASWTLELPLRSNVGAHLASTRMQLPDRILDATSLRGLLEAVIAEAAAATARFDEVFGERA